MNNDFMVTIEAIRQWFSRVTRSLVKIIGESLHEWPKSLFTISHTPCYFLQAILLLFWTLETDENKLRLFIIVVKDSLF